jgi:hypothetical protein
VSGSGIAIMSDSSIALKPVIDEPSKPMPSSSAPSSSSRPTEKLFSCPMMSVNQNRMNSTPSSWTRLSTSPGLALGLVAVAIPYFLLCQCFPLSRGGGRRSGEVDSQG